jgi:ABC-type spermidine/putrescine transport system permease subunit II
MSEQNRPSLTYPAVIAGAVAAATATVLSTRLGLVGTVVGAVVASVVSTLVSTVFARWLERTHGRVTAARDLGPRLWQRFAVGAVALALVGVAFHSGLALLTSDLPQDAFASRLLTQLGDTFGG